MASLQKGKFSYSEEQATRWLSWLARRMQEHGQTTFLIEQLQPSWLRPGRETWLYLLATRLVGSLIATSTIASCCLVLPSWNLYVVSLLSSLVLGTWMGLSFSLISGWQFFVWRREQQKNSRKSILFRSLDGLITGLGVFAGGALICWLLPPTAACFGILSLVIVGSYLVYRFHRKPTDDIWIFEILSWSWLGALRTAGLSLLALITFSMIFWHSSPLISLIYYLVIIVILSTIAKRAMLGGFQRKTVRAKVHPLQAIRLSQRNVAFAIACAGITAFFTFLMIRSYEKALIGYTSGTALAAEPRLMSPLSASAAVLAGLAALHFGGLDMIHHYILRAILNHKDFLPKDIVKFLDYTVDELHFLQRVGGGYMFIHRSLLEYFAELGNDVAGEAEAATWSPS